jgi:uncharacterized protein YeaO (DUF488 family)
MLTITINRVYDPPGANDGWRVLVDGLWPRGISRSKAKIDEWLKEIAPSESLRKAFGHDRRHWESFRRRYRAQLRTRKRLALARELARRARAGRVAIVYAARDRQHNNAVVLKEFLEELMERPDNRLEGQ